MNRPQTFSHDHRPMYRMGTVNIPFITPAIIAKAMPRTTYEVTLIDAPSGERGWYPFAEY